MQKNILKGTKIQLRFLCLDNHMVIIKVSIRKEILENLKNFFLFLCSGFLDLYFMIYLYMDKWR